MIVYHSAMNIDEEFNDLLLEHNLSVNELRSFYPKPKSDRPESVSKMFLDSGAFSAYNKGIELDVKEYARYISEHGDEWDDIAGLDVIFDVEQTMQNQQYLDEQGLDTIPTFHYKNPVSHLHHLLDNYSHIAIGGMKRARTSDGLKYFLENCWNIIEQERWNGKVHGFALTSFVLMKRYPWHSVDSTTAPTAARVGELLSPWGRLPVSSGITRNTQINTPRKLDRIFKWVDELTDSSFDVKKITESSTEGTKYRSLVNLKYMEQKISEFDNMQKKKITGLF